MKRKCDQCEKEASVHEVNIRNGEKVERHLCADCAAELGIAAQSHVPIADLFTNFITAQSAAQHGSKRAVQCPTCGMTYGDFRQGCLLGCADCYTAFEAQLSTLLERAHDGATHHVGKVPHRMAGAIDRQERITLLRKQLADAIEAEEYERAAALRDQIAVTSKQTSERGITGGDAAHDHAATGEPGEDET